MTEHRPLGFKRAMKKLVRRACVTAVGYIELNFEREMGAAPEVVARLNDAKARMERMERLMEEAAEGEVEEDDAEFAELGEMVKALMAEPEVVLREGLVFDFPKSTDVIPDQRCESIVGFEGARHLTVQYMFSPEEVKEHFGVDLGNGYTPWGRKGKDDEETYQKVGDADFENEDLKDKSCVRVFKHYDKVAGLVYYLADGYKDFLREPGPPDVFVEDFWPIYALTFNEVEDENTFPPSDIELLMSQQEEYNKARQGKREHRYAALPRWGYSKSALQEDDVKGFVLSKPFTATAFNMAPGQKIGDLIGPIPVPGVDPNLYDTNEIMTDIQLVGGAQDANYGGVAKATATESAIAANATLASDNTAIDDLDEFLSLVARGAGQVLLREMSIDQVKMIAGRGAVWPEGMTLSDIADEIYLEIEAGSSGKPNQAVELDNWQKILPFAIQMPGINPMWLAKETLRRLDDKADLTEAFVSGMPSIIAQNAMQRPGGAEPGSDPAAQGDEGADNQAGPAEEQRGSEAAFGSNQV